MSILNLYPEFAWSGRQVKAPWLKSFYFVDGDTYIIPGIDFVTLGGTRNFGSNNAEVNKYDSQAIWEGCLAVVPSLKDAEVRNGQGAKKGVSIVYTPWVSMSP